MRARASLDGLGFSYHFSFGSVMNNDSSDVRIEAYRLSEERLRSQLTSALASDQRCVQASSLSVASAAILASLSEQAALPEAFLVGALVLLVAAFLAAYAARPTDFYMPGAKYDDLQEDISKTRGLERVLRDLGRYNDKHSDHNDRVMKRAGWFLRWSFWFSIAGVLTAILPQFEFFRALASRFWEYLLVVLT